MIWFGKVVPRSKQLNGAGAGRTFTRRSGVRGLLRGKAGGIGIQEEGDEGFCRHGQNAGIAQCDKRERDVYFKR